jgi:hypothetical protein
METKTTEGVILHEMNGEVISLRGKDGYVNATAMCKAVGKQFNDYSRNASTKEFLGELSSDTGIPVTGLIVTVQGGLPKHQGTWVHPKVAINLAQWLSPKFAVAVSEWVFQWMTGNIPGAKLPYHLRRYMANRSEIPHTHFSMLNELLLGLVAPFEREGYVLPEGLTPDISMGKMFCRWLREEKGMDTDTFPTYEHVFENGRTVQAKLYPLSLLEDFRKHFYRTWLPLRAADYFHARDPEALNYLPRVLEAQRKLSLSS